MSDATIETVIFEDEDQDETAEPVVIVSIPVDESVFYGERVYAVAIGLDVVGYVVLRSTGWDAYRNVDGTLIEVGREYKERETAITTVLIYRPDQDGTIAIEAPEDQDETAVDFYTLTAIFEGAAEDEETIRGQDVDEATERAKALFAEWKTEKYPDCDVALFDLSTYQNVLEHRGSSTDGFGDDQPEPDPERRYRDQTDPGYLTDLYGGAGSDYPDWYE